FLSLELENVRCFSEKQRLDLSDGHGRPARWTILLGENGTGKTTILQLLAAGEPVFVGSRNPESPTRVPVYLLQEVPSFRRSDTKAVAVARFAETSGLVENKTVAESAMALHEYDEGKGCADYYENVQYPVCHAYGAGRRSRGSSFDRSGLLDSVKSLFFDDA